MDLFLETGSPSRTQPSMSTTQARSRYRQVNDTPSGDQRMMELVSRTLFAEALARKVKVAGGCAPAVRFNSNRASDLSMAEVGATLTTAADVTRMEAAAECPP